jgi:hypothetical protein
MFDLSIYSFFSAVCEKVMMFAKSRMATPKECFCKFMFRFFLVTIKIREYLVLIAILLINGKKTQWILKLTQLSASQQCFSPYSYLPAVWKKE